MIMSGECTHSEPETKPEHVQCGTGTVQPTLSESEKITKWECMPGCTCVGQEF